jgi:hypothetical protein
MNKTSKQMSFVSNGGKFKLDTAPNGSVFSTATQHRFSFERMIFINTGQSRAAR